MSKLISEILGSFEGKSGLIKFMVFDKASMYPWTIKSQECLRLSMFLSRFGPQSTLILQGLVEGKFYQTTGGFAYTEYGPHTLIQIKANDADKRGFQFGASKAKKLIDAIAKYGMSAFLATLVEVAGDAKVTDSTPRKGGKAKGKAKGGKGKAKPAMPSEAEYMDIQEEFLDIEADDQPTLDIDALIAAKGREVLAAYELMGRLQAEMRALQAV